MKQLAKHSLVALAGLTIGLFLTGCASTSIKQVSGKEFLNQAEQIEQTSTFSWATYIGSSSDRAYLQSGHPSLLYNIIGKETRTIVYWTKLSELPEDIADQLKAGNPPWKPLRAKTNETERAIDADD